MRFRIFFKQKQCLQYLHQNLFKELNENVLAYENSCVNKNAFF